MHDQRIRDYVPSARRWFKPRRIDVAKRVCQVLRNLTHRIEPASAGVDLVRSGFIVSKAGMWGERETRRGRARVIKTQQRTP